MLAYNYVWTGVQTNDYYLVWIAIELERYYNCVPTTYILKTKIIEYGIFFFFCKLYYRRIISVWPVGVVRNETRLLPAVVCLRITTAVRSDRKPALELYSYFANTHTHTHAHTILFGRKKSNYFLTRRKLLFVNFCQSITYIIRVIHPLISSIRSRFRERYLVPWPRF